MVVNMQRKCYFECFLMGLFFCFNEKEKFKPTNVAKPRDLLFFSFFNSISFYGVTVEPLSSSLLDYSLNGSRYLSFAQLYKRYL